MKEIILQRLSEIEKNENIRILLAVESGSRAWGFSSPDSDYDIRFIYIRPLCEYLKLAQPRDVIEKPINDVLDINGWDLAKTLRLLYKSNPTLFEWFSSPIVYRETSFADDLRAILNRFFLRKHCLHHYLNMAAGNYRNCLRTDYVKAKKYFYVLRPLLACRWILNRRTPPPMLFQELVNAELPEILIKDIDYLLKLKLVSPETKEIARIDTINRFLDAEIENLEQEIAILPESERNNWEELDQLFLQEVMNWNESF